ncbi:AAA family ATPase [Paenibacillus amylolyticus]|nr:AAA family ATPase [Paenibacillus amylolyticus]WFR64176.1 AAA family ATPase [Paenibacillus amylolyticus]
MIATTPTARIAADLIMLLQREGFIIQRYDSKTTSSIYLKLDYGVCNSIRIGDHRGKKQYKYRYNVDVGRKQINRHKTPEGWARWYYPETALRNLLQDVVKERQLLKNKQGEEHYRFLMAQRELEGRGTKGFWQSATLVDPNEEGGSDVGDYQVNEKAKDALNRLTSLPGMHAIKEQVDEMVHFSRIAALRKKHRLKTSTQTNHMIFTGNPGTGKTTAARLIGEAFAEIGLLKRADKKEIPFVEIHQSMIAAPHVGEAERALVAKFNEARGGVLFIDEAYAFTPSKETSHRQADTVLATMVQCIEDMRDEVVVIAAGYPEDMAKFIKANPGLASRFPTTIHFPDYPVPELVQIGFQMCIDQEYQPDNAYLDALASVLWIEKGKPNFGNARTVRNQVERSIRRQSMRVSQMQNPTRKDLATLTAVDLVHSVEGVKGTEVDVLHRTIKEAQARIFVLDLIGLNQRQN